VKLAPQVKADAVGGSLALRETIFGLVGLTPAALAKRVSQDLVAIDEARRATVIQRLVVPGAKGEGATVAEYTDVDHSMRLRATDMDLSVVGMYPSRSSQGAAGSASCQIVNVKVILKDMSPASRVPRVIDVVGTPAANEPSYASK